MSHLNRSLVLLVFYLAIIFNVEKLPFTNQSLFQLHTFVEPLIAIAIIVTFLVPRLQRFGLFFQLALWTVIYFGLLFLFERESGMEVLSLQLMLTEITVSLIAVAIAHDIATELREIEGSLDRLVYSTFSGRTVKLDDAGEEIKIELTRSRRYQRPLTLLVIEPDTSALREDLQPTLKEIQHNLARRYAMARISEILNREARRTDLIVKQDHPDRFILLCPETASTDSNTLVRRIQDAVQDSLGVSVSWGIASFPEDGLTFEGLVGKAHNKLLKPVAYSMPTSDSAESKEKSSKPA
jgi:GGDEF domain-containing protein